MASFVVAHTLFAIFLGRLYALAPDESGYLYTFNHIYVSDSNANPQYQSGWITAPKLFLWIAYLPAKLLNLLGVADYLSIRILSIALAVLSVYLLKGVFESQIKSTKIPAKLVFIFFLIPSVFLWTSVGLRESFIMAELAIFLAGFNFLFMTRTYGHSHSSS